MSVFHDSNDSSDVLHGRLFYLAAQSPSLATFPPPVAVTLSRPEHQSWSLAWWSCCAVAASLTLFYLSTWVLFVVQQQDRRSTRLPPLVPYVLPFVGHAFRLLIDPGRGLIQIGQQIGPRTIHRIKIIGHDICFIYGPQNIARLRKYPRTITTPGVTTFVLKTLFGMAPKAFNMYTKDDSGIYANPRAGTQIAPHNRIDHLTHANFHKHLLGEGLSGIYRGFAVSFMERLPSLELGSQWKYFPDLVEFWLPSMTSAMNEALAGPIIEAVDPDFTAKLLKYYPYLHGLMKGVPGWWMFEARRLRKDLINDVKIWHAIARAQFRDGDVDPITKRDPWWGSAFMRERQSILTKVDNWDADAVASSDFGIFWGSSVNIHPMAVWSIVEIFRDRDLLQRVREELCDIHFQGIVSGDEVDKLLAIPLLQSIYSELLRLRVQVQTLFYSDAEDIRVNEWQIPRGSLVVTAAGPAHRDPGFWNARNGERPLDSFWADRFLVYPHDPLSGPHRVTKPTTDHAAAPKTHLQTPSRDNKPKFVSSGLTDSFMPYGIGERTCPGRGFARREIITVCALIADRFDIEFLDGRQDWGMSTTFYGIGTQRPRSKIPFRIRSRADR